MSMITFKIEIAFKYYELQAFIIFMTYSTQ